jgi:hypothetical protein
VDRQRNAPELYQTSPNLSTITAARRKLTGLRTVASIMRREACSASTCWIHRPALEKFNDGTFCKTTTVDWIKLRPYFREEYDRCLL